MTNNFSAWDEPEAIWRKIMGFKYHNRLSQSLKVHNHQWLTDSFCNTIWIVKHCYFASKWRFKQTSLGNWLFFDRSCLNHKPECRQPCFFSDTYQTLINVIIQLWNKNSLCTITLILKFSILFIFVLAFCYYQSRANHDTVCVHQLTDKHAHTGYCSIQCAD